MPPPFSHGFPPGAVLLDARDPSGVAAVDFAGLTPSEFLFFMLVWFLNTSAGSDQQLRLQVNGDSTSGHYLWSLSDGNNSGSDTAASIGWVAQGTQGWMAGQCVMPAQHGGGTRSGFCQSGGRGASDRNVIGNPTFSFNISANISSIHLFAASGNLTGHVRLWGLP